MWDFYDASRKTAAIKEPWERGEVSMDTNDISHGKPNKYSYFLPTVTQKDPFVFYSESYVYTVSGVPIPSGKPVTLSMVPRQNWSSGPSVAAVIGPPCHARSPLLRTHMMVDVCLREANYGTVTH